ncbi:hypothetical protein ISCGN_012523 [Ixodes scapularis]
MIFSCWKTIAAVWILDYAADAATNEYIYPTIIYPRNITMGFGYNVKYLCVLHVSDETHYDIIWHHGDSMLTSDSKRTVEVKPDGPQTLISHLEVRDLNENDAGSYSCSAIVKVGETKVVPDVVYLNLTDAATNEYIYPTIIYPRNITMGFGYNVKYLCVLHVSDETHYDITWHHGDSMLTSDSKRTVEVKPDGPQTLISHLEVRDLNENDAGSYSCSAIVKVGETKVVPDVVYLNLTDYRAAHWSEPCLNDTSSCVDTNTGCFSVSPPLKHSPTSFACQCQKDFPIYNPEGRRCDKGSRLGEPCEIHHQCTWFTDYSECASETCQCVDGFKANLVGTKCTNESFIDYTCTFDWECGDTGMVCLDGACRYNVAISGGQIALLTLLSLIGFLLLIYLCVLCVRCFRQRKSSKRRHEPEIFIVPMNS